MAFTLEPTTAPHVQENTARAIGRASKNGKFTVVYLESKLR